MQVSNTNNLTFQSKIRIVSPQFFQYKSMKMWKNPNCKLIDVWDIIPRYEMKDFPGYRTNMDLGFTYGVRTCTAGVVVNQGKPASLFMHLLNSSANLKHMSFIKDYFKGTNAILVGSKDNFSYSIQVFNKLKNYTLNNGIPFTIMRRLAREWQANLAYVSKEDTLYLCVNNIIENTRYVKNMKQLQETFKEIEISPTDTVEFLSWSKELLLRLLEK